MQTALFKAIREDAIRVGPDFKGADVGAIAAGNIRRRQVHRAGVSGAALACGDSAATVVAAIEGIAEAGQGMGERGPAIVSKR